MPPAPRADPQPPADAARLRVRQAGIVIGALPTGPSNAITDVAGVAVGHATVVRGTAVRTGVTVVVPHSGNLFRDKVPAAVFVANGFGKLVGSTQIVELGELESPIALTNTLSVGRVADALVGHVLALPGNESVRSVNVVVGETNDGFLNDIRGRHVGAEHLEQALRNARGGPVVEGGVGAGAGTVCFGWKGGIGTASRRVSEFTVGVLVQTNFGGALTVAGVPVHRTLRAPRRQRTGDGSCMIVIATDAPLGARNLRRLAARAFAGMARTGASFANGSGDYAIAFSTATSQRIRAGAPRSGGPVLANPRMSPLFLAVAEATEEAILNSLFAARRVSGARGVVEALPVERVVALVRGR
ncbi:MAG: P1 family peptidase [Planctomycetes bacterium]|nr:P1 family peptidase [Planctomycetota bacterium]